jgi:hypothetical protein
MNTPFKAEKVGQRSDGKVEENIHAARVYGVDETDPVSNSAPVRIQDGEVEW